MSRAVVVDVVVVVSRRVVVSGFVLDHRDACGLSSAVIAMNAVNLTRCMLIEVAVVECRSLLEETSSFLLMS